MRGAVIHKLAFSGTVGSAALSSDGRYRYLLRRTWKRSAPHVLFVMLNPSTADAHQDDATIRRCTGFAREWGYGGFTVGNLYALRATDPRELHRAMATGEDAVGKDNAASLVLARKAASACVVAWGNNALGYPAHVSTMLEICLGKTEAGAPRHPLRIARSTPLQAYP